jgi:cyclic pyranopterin monophosphate synthase
MTDKSLSHIDADGNASMVDVSDKEVTHRIATAAGSVLMEPETMRLIQQGDMKKGDVISVARLAGIMGAKKTPELIPLCHPLALEAIDVELTLDPARNAVDITATLTIYDMCKAVDRTMRLTDIRLQAKSGGRSGDFRNKD